MVSLLVPLDGSPTAEAAIPHAVRLAHDSESSVILFVVAGVSTAGFREFADVESVSIADAAETYLNRLRDELATSVHLSSRVSTGNSAASDILAYVENTDTEISMIVMARHGRHGPSQWLIGSVADKIVRASTVPVLIVPV